MSTGGQKRQGRYGRFFTWRTAILNSNLEPTTRHVLLTLACHMNDAGESCFPSVVLLAKETGLSDRTIITHLGIAREDGWITSEKHGFSGQRWANNEYRMAWPRTLSAEDGEGGELASPPFSLEPDESYSGQSESTGEPASNQATSGSGEVVKHVPEGGESVSKGGEAGGGKVVNHVHASTPLNSPENSPRNTSLPPDGGASETRSQERKRDLLWEAMLAGCGIPLHASHTKSERGKWNTALKMLREAGATPEEIRVRCKRYRKIWPKVSLTPTALAANWNTIVSENTGSRPRDMTGDLH